MMKRFLRRRAAACLVCLSFSAALPSLHSMALAQTADSTLESETLAIWQQAKSAIAAGNFSQATTLLSAQQAKLEAKVGATHKLTLLNKQMLDVAQQSAAAMSAPVSPPAPPSADTPGREKKNLPVRPEDVDRTKAAMARAKEARALVTAKRDDEAMPKLDAAVGIMEETLGPDNELVKANRDLLLLLYKKHNKPDSAAAAEARAAKNRATYKPPGQASPEVEATMQTLMRAMSAFQSHDFDTALKLFEEAQPMVEKTITSTEAKVNFSSVHASLCDYATQYDRAEILHKKAAADMEKAVGPDSIELATYLESIVTHYLRRMEPQKAVPYATRIVALQRRHRPGTPELADALRSLGDMKLVSDDRSGMDDLSEAMGLVSKIQPPDARRMLAISQSLAQAADISGDPATALQIKSQACQMATGLSDSEVVSDARSSCIEAAWAQGDLAKADTLLQEALAATERKYSNPRSVLWAPLQHNLSLVRYARGEREQALTMAAELEEVNERKMARELSTGSDAQKRAVFETYLTRLNDILSMGADGSGGQQAIRLGLTALLRQKGRSLDASADAARAQRLLTTPEQRALLARQRELRGLMVGLVLRGNKDLDPAATTAAIQKLEAEEESVTKQLAQSSAQYRALTAPISIEAVQAKLPADTALVEYVAFLRRDKNLYRPAEKRYYAYVLRASGEPAAFDLGDALPITRVSEELRKAIRERRDASGPARALEELIVRPLRAQLGGIKRLVVSPDDDLNLVPFAALKDSSGKYLLEQYEVDYLTSGRDLLRLGAMSDARSTPIFVGNPDFDAGANAAPAPSSAGQRSGDLARARFSALPGTDQEVRAIAKLLGESRLFTGRGATKSVLQALDAPLVLHIATHGFFLDDQKRSAKNARGLELELGDDSPPTRPPSSENPLIRSGLALTGANDKASVNGILTALEASNVNLDGTRLVVLSACETALGQVAMGDGVYGLRRALLVAGSQTQVMSLWKVDDNATRDLMIGFYTGLREGRGRGQSLREVQLTMLKKKEYAHPYFWAAFIPSGSWEKMDFSLGSGTAAGATSGGASASRTGSDVGSSTRDVVTSDGTHYAVFVRRMALSNLAPQPDRGAWSIGFTFETDVLSGPKEGETGLGFHDAGVMELELGLRTTAPYTYPDGSQESSGLAYGYFFAYEIGVGYRGHPIGLLAGFRPGLRGASLGDARTFGTLLPAFGTLEIQTGDDDMLAISGWYGESLSNHSSLGVRGDLTLHNGFFRVQAEQYKLDTTLAISNPDDRQEIGRQVNTAYTFAIGAHL